MSSISAQPRATKKRDYRLGRRAEKQQETRRRIVEAAVDLHGSIGPAATSIAKVAERAGVQRHTVYAHFPDERSLLMACSGLSLERDPLPDPDQWLEKAPGAERIRRALEEIYGWYARNAELAGCVLRDAQKHELTREITALRMGPTFTRAAEVMGEALGVDQRALVAVAIDFACWRALQQARRTGTAADIMTRSIVSLGRDDQSR